MFGLGPATKIYIGVEAVDMRKYAPSMVMWSRLLGAPESARFGGSGRRITGVLLFGSQHRQ
jgi:hypothetical protein